ncbi:MAG: serine/threonine-protein phosphatase [Planctomycetes bacterium]|nr:serine/threonine-protein phosphatase [Planctomycetota bacterium]
MKVRADVLIAFASDRGVRRIENQDDVLIYEPADDDAFLARGRMLALADGMGGTVAGAEASRVALRSLLASWLDAPLDMLQDGDSLKVRLRDAFAAAQRALDDAAMDNHRLDGMGTTLTAIVHRGARVIGVHVGDSRALVINEDGARWLTTLHTTALDSSRLTRALIARASGGVDLEPAEPELFDTELESGDRLLVMSDGLWRAIPEAEGLAIIHSCPPREAVAELVGRARAIDGSDNASIVVLEYRGDGAGTSEEVVESAVNERVLRLTAGRVPGRIGAAWPWALFALGLVLLAVASWLWWR